MKRVLCKRCERPVSVCLCKDLESAFAPVDIVILQTRREQKHALNSGRIVRLAVANSRTFVGEDFSEHQELQALLQENRGRVWLLYPGEWAMPPAHMLKRSGGSPGLLIVLDATWRKSRRMLHLCPLLAELPRVCLAESSVSRYRIRKVPGDGYLSTVEAVAGVLEQVGHPPALCRQMLGAFEQLIDHQISAMGADTYLSNYSS